MAIRSSFDPDTALRAHFAREIDELRRAALPAPRVRPDADSRNSATHTPSTGAWVPEAVAAAILAISIGAASLGLEMRSQAADLVSSTIASEAWSRFGSSLSQAVLKALAALGEPPSSVRPFRGRLDSKE